jgi:hypothetical protein
VVVAVETLLVRQVLRAVDVAVVAVVLVVEVAVRLRERSGRAREEVIGEREAAPGTQDDERPEDDQQEV